MLQIQRLREMVGDEMLRKIGLQDWVVTDLIRFM